MIIRKQGGVRDGIIFLVIVGGALGALAYAIVIFECWFIVGIFLILISLASGINQMNFINKAISADGRIIDLKEGRDSDNDLKFTPVIQFQLEDGSIQTFVSRDWSYRPRYKVGNSVKVLYDPQNPQNAEINSFASLWLSEAMIFLLGVFFFII